MNTTNKTAVEVGEIINQVLCNPQVSYPPISYSITAYDHSDDENYVSEYIDRADFDSYLKRLESQLISRLTT